MAILKNDGNGEVGWYVGSLTGAVEGEDDGSGVGSLTGAVEGEDDGSGVGS